MPLTNAVLHVLMALTRQDLHGYGIMLEIRSISRGEFQLGPGTLYDNLRSLLARGFVTDYEQSTGDATARRMYHLTDAGATALAAELERLQSMVRAGRKLLAAKAAMAPREPLREGQ